MSEDDFREWQLRVIRALRTMREAHYVWTRLDGHHLLLCGVLMGNGVGYLAGRTGLIDSAIFALSVTVLSFALMWKSNTARKRSSVAHTELLEAIAPSVGAQEPPIPAGRVEHLN